MSTSNLHRQYSLVFPGDAGMVLSLTTLGDGKVNLYAKESDPEPSLFGRNYNFGTSLNLNLDALATAIFKLQSQIEDDKARGLIL